MAGDTQGAGQTNFKVPDEMRNMAERSVTQARQALESFLQAARRTTESMEQTSGRVQAGAKDAAQKTLSAVEQEPPGLLGLRGPPRAGQGPARGGADPVRVRPHAN